MKIKFNLISLTFFMALLLLAGCGSDKQVVKTQEVKEVPAQALELIREFTGNPELQLIYLGADDIGHNLINKDDNQEYKVSKEYDKIVFVSQKNLNIKLKKGKVNFREAKEEAKGFAVKHYPALNELIPDFSDQQEAKVQDNYSFSWQRIEKGVRLPTWLKVEVDGRKGKIIAFEYRDYPTKINLEPVVKREEAIKLAKSQELSAQAKINISSTELFAGSFSGRERLIWYVSLIITLPKAQGEELIYGREVYLDANSSEIIRSEKTGP